MSPRIFSGLILIFSAFPACDSDGFSCEELGCGPGFDCLVNGETDKVTCLCQAPDAVAGEACVANSPPDGGVSEEDAGADDRDAGAPLAQTCVARGCDYNSTDDSDCSCTPDCLVHGNCCGDYGPVCGGDPGEEWSCDADLFGDGVCDCGCGERDPDCIHSGTSICERDHCEAPSYVGPNRELGNHECANCYVDEDCLGFMGQCGAEMFCTWDGHCTGPIEGQPSDWPCDDGDPCTVGDHCYGTLLNECVSGEIDPTCEVGDAGVADPESCAAKGCGYESNQVSDCSCTEDCLDHYNCCDDFGPLCGGEPSGVWTCEDNLFGDGVCDCGCGEWDPDCSSAYPQVCDRDHCEEPFVGPKPGANWGCAECYVVADCGGPQPPCGAPPVGCFFGECDYSPSGPGLPSNTPCDDGDPCTVGDHCAGDHVNDCVSGEVDPMCTAGDGDGDSSTEQ